MTAYLRFAAVVLVWLTLSVLPASSHPLGNFTINHLTKLSFRPARVDARYVLDMAEIPTYQVTRAISDRPLSSLQLAAWAASEGTVVAHQLALRVAGKDVPLTIVGTRARTRPGAGGLPTLYLTVDLRGPLPPASTAARAFAYRDDTYPNRLGWHDVVVAPATEPTRELQTYPSAMLGSPRAVTAVAGTLGPGGRIAVRAVAEDVAAQTGAPPSAVRSNQLSDMLARGTGDWSFVLVTFLVAIALGALHALEPGHGKTLLAVSLVGARATVKQAAILASALTVAHTIGVLALGVAINLFKGYFVPEAIYPWITLLSGIVIAVIGARAVQRQTRLRAAVAQVHSHDHTHAHALDHAHVGGHDHSHAHGDLDEQAHARAHAIPGTAPLTFGGTVWAAMSGGVAPCPAALVVLLAAIALNEVAYGIFVIVAFSFGLAATLTGLGIAVVRGASWLQGRPQFERFVRFGPLVSAIVISTIGAIMVGQGFAEQSASLSPLAISAVVALAIAAYAFALPLALRRPANA
jgi:nickel/cobalt exporter